MPFGLHGLARYMQRESLLARRLGPLYTLGYINIQNIHHIPQFGWYTTSKYRHAGKVEIAGVHIPN